MNWHDRYLQQARWSRELRAYLFKQCRLDQAQRVLEVGCGTGAILGEIPVPPARFGLDLEAGALAQCRIHAPGVFLIRGDAHHLPYPPATFDLTFCHFLLLWVRDPLQVLREMKRVTRRGGYVLALAEPDYEHRQDEPPALRRVGQWQNEALRRQSAKIGFGARLAETFHRAGIELLETGAIQRSGPEAPEKTEQALEWAVLESDLRVVLPTEEILKIKALEEQAWAEGKRVIYVPTYFAWGKVNET